MRLTFIFAILWTSFSFAQFDSTYQLSPGGFFETVFDRFGNQYSLSEIRVDTSSNAQGQYKSQIICNNTGYFELYFEQGCGMEDIQNPSHNARRGVICQVFKDLSDFIIPADINNKVRIHIRDIASMNVTSSAVLGVASPFFTVPAFAPSISGITDNEIWKTINSGEDSYTNVSMPLSSSPSGNQFYHGQLAINFNAINWHLDLNSVPGSGEYDLYTVALHEISHALGIASNITSNGNSILGATYNYYSRYDLFLETPQSVPLITNSGQCSMYEYMFNPSLTPSSLGSISIDCNDQLRFMGTVDQALYSPSTFVPGSSLSHFKDGCYIDLSGQLDPQPDYEYYVMSSGVLSGTASMKRYYKPEERKVLCDIGYKVNSIYGLNSSVLGYQNIYFDYQTTNCSGLEVAGINDGIQNGSFVYQISVGSTMTIDGILDNDFPSNGMPNTAISPICVESVYGGGNVLSTSSTGFIY